MVDNFEETPEAPGAAALPREVLVGVTERDPRALSEFFEFGFDRVYSLAFRLLGERADAEDAAQEVFLKVYRAADSLDPDRNPMPWLTVITYNVCRDALRSRKRNVARTVAIEDDAAGARELAASGPDPEASALAGERERLVQAALNRLPEDLRAVVVLRDYHGMRHEEIANVVGAGHSAVRKRYSRALAKLAAELEGIWDE